MSERTTEVYKDKFPQKDYICIKKIKTGIIVMFPETEADAIMEDIKNLR